MGLPIYERLVFYTRTCGKSYQRRGLPSLQQNPSQEHPSALGCWRNQPQAPGSRREESGKSYTRWRRIRSAKANPTLSAGSGDDAYFTSPKTSRASAMLRTTIRFGSVFSANACAMRASP